MACDNHTETREILKEVEASTKSAHHRIDSLEGRLGKDEAKIDTLTCSDSTNTQAIKELCNKIDGLVNTIKWFIGLGVTLILGIGSIAVAILLR
jgi:hypothetical protein